MSVGPLLLIEDATAPTYGDIARRTNTAARPTTKSISGATPIRTPPRRTVLRWAGDRTSSFSIATYAGVSVLCRPRVLRSSPAYRRRIGRAACREGEGSAVGG